MKFLTIDPGLDYVAIAAWDWKRVSPDAHHSLEAMFHLSTGPEDVFTKRVRELHTGLQDILEAHPVAAVFMEKPSRGGIYERTSGVRVAVSESLYWSNLAGGVLLHAVAQRDVPMHLLEPPAKMRKGHRQLFGDMVLKASELTLPRGRKKWNADDRDAVAIGCQVMSLPRFFYLCG